MAKKYNKKHTNCRAVVYLVVKAVKGDRLLCLPLKHGLVAVKVISLNSSKHIDEVWKIFDFENINNHARCTSIARG